MNEGLSQKIICRDSRPRLSGGAKLRSACGAICLVLLSNASASFAQAPDSASARKDVYAELLKAPKKAAARPNPLEHDPDALAAGAKLFEQHCAECHGGQAEGTKKAPTLRAPEIEQATPGTLCWLLTNGVVRRGMPVWSKLPEPQRWQLVSHIKSLNPGPKPAEGEKSAPNQASSNRPERRRR